MVGLGLGNRFGRGGSIGKSSSGSSYTTVSPPASLGWTPSLNVRKNNATGVYSTDFDVTSVKPTPVYNYYISPSGSGAASPSDNDPNTPITIDRFATLANANGGIVRGYLAGGNHYTTSGLSLSGSGVIFEPWVGQGTGAARVIKRSTGVDPVWTADTGTTYTTPHTIANTDVYDYSVLDSNGMPSRLIAATSIANCRATAGSYFYDSAGGNMYVKAGNLRNLVGDTDMLVPTYNGTATITLTTSTKAQTAWIKSIMCVGTFSFTQTGAFRSLFYTNFPYFIGGDTNSQSVLGPIDCYHMSPRVGGALNDGLNYHGNGAGDPRFFEYDYRGTRSGWQSGGTANNASTCHENAIGICVAGDYPGSQNRPIHDINAAKRWMVGSTVRASAASDSTSITVQAGTGSGSADTAQIWLEDCTIEESTTAAIYADTSAQINYRLTNEDIKSSGLGILAPYKYTAQGGPSIVMGDKAASNTSASSYNLPVGTMSGAYALIAVTGRTAGVNPTGCTAGNAGKFVYSASNGTDFIYYYIVKNPSGTTISVTMSGTATRCGVMVRCFNGIKNSIPYQRGGSTVNPATATLTVPAGGVACGDSVALLSTGSSNAWTNLTARTLPFVVAPTLYEANADAISAGGGSLAMTDTWTNFSSGASVFATFPSA